MPNLDMCTHHLKLESHLVEEVESRSEYFLKINLILNI
jgi:hypothetical protein